MECHSQAADICSCSNIHPGLYLACPSIACTCRLPLFLLHSNHSGLLCVLSTPRLTPTSGPLPSLCPLPGMTFLQVSAWLEPSPFSKEVFKCYLLKKICFNNIPKIGPHLSVSLSLLCFIPSITLIHILHTLSIGLID